MARAKHAARWGRTMEQIKDELLDGRDLSKKGQPQAAARIRRAHRPQSGRSDVWLTLGARQSRISDGNPAALSSSSRLNRRLAPEPTSRIGEGPALTIPLAKNLSGNGLLNSLILQGF